MSDNSRRCCREFHPPWVRRRNLALIVLVGLAAPGVSAGQFLSYDQAGPALSARSSGIADLDGDGRDEVVGCIDNIAYFYAWDEHHCPASTSFASSPGRERSRGRPCCSINRRAFPPFQPSGQRSGPSPVSLS